MRKRLYKAAFGDDTALELPSSKQVSESLWDSVEIKETLQCGQQLILEGKDYIGLAQLASDCSVLDFHFSRITEESTHKNRISSLLEVEQYDKPRDVVSSLKLTTVII